MLAFPGLGFFYSVEALAAPGEIRRRTESVIAPLAWAAAPIFTGRWRCHWTCAFQLLDLREDFAEVLPLRVIILFGGLRTTVDPRVGQ